MNDQQPDRLCGWVKLWHRTGVLVTLPVGVGFNFPEAFADIDRAFEAGFIGHEPGLEPGEIKEMVGWVVRSMKQGRSGVADMLALYSTNDAWTKPFLTVYLNTEEDRSAFEAAAGMSLSSLPEYIGEGRLERGKNPSADKLIAKVAKPFGVVMKPNPKWNQAEYDAAKSNPSGKPYVVPKKVFVRWDGAKAAQPAEAHSGDLITSGQIAEMDGMIAELDRRRPYRFDIGRFLNYLNEVFKTNVVEVHQLTQAQYATAKESLSGMLNKAKGG